MTCKLCGQNKKLIDAHIIPRSFYEQLKEDGQILRIITGKDDVFPMKSRIGIYDQDILCKECENIFSPWDDYGYNFLNRNTSNDRYIWEDTKKIGYNMGQCDYRMLKLFFLSVLWRADASKQPMFKEVQLGPYTNKIHNCILTTDPGKVEDYPVILFRLNSPVVTIPSPRKTKLYGVIWYRIYFGEYMATIIMTNKKFSAIPNILFLAPGRDVLVYIWEDYIESNDFKNIVYVANKAFFRMQNKLGRDSGAIKPEV